VIQLLCNLEFILEMSWLLGMLTEHPTVPAKRLPSRKFQRDAGLNAEQTPFQLPKPNFDLFNQLQRSKVL
jgi:hypothetical protein